MLYCLAGVTKEDLASFPTETLLLASNAKGRELIAYNRKANGFSLVTKPADANITARQNILSQKIDSVYSMAFDRKHEADHYLKGKPYIE